MSWRHRHVEAERRRRRWRRSARIGRNHILLVLGRGKIAVVKNQNPITAQVSFIANLLYLRFLLADLPDACRAGHGGWQSWLRIQRTPMVTSLLGRPR